MLSPIEPGSDIHDFIVEDLTTGEIMPQMDMDRRGIVFTRPRVCGFIDVNGEWYTPDYRA